MQDRFFSSPLSHVTQTLDILRQANLTDRNLAQHKDTIAIFDLVVILNKVGILTQENYDGLLRVEDLDSVASIIDALYCSDLLMSEKSQEYINVIFPLIKPKALAQSICLLGSQGFLIHEVFCAAIKHPDHERCAVILEKLYNKNELTCGRVAVVLCNQELTTGSSVSCRLL
jgi:hypothetical protein